MQLVSRPGSLATAYFYLKVSEPEDLKHVLSFLIAALAADCLSLAQPARALTGAGLYVHEMGQGGVAAVPSVGCRQSHAYRGGWQGKYKPRDSKHAASESAPINKGGES